jgi:hypothetical protein
MTYEDAIECDSISLSEALHELTKHFIVADFEGDEIFDCVSGETIAWGTDGHFKGADILAWLGY